MITYKFIKFCQLFKLIAPSQKQNYQRLILSSYNEISRKHIVWRVLQHQRLKGFPIWTLAFGQKSLYVLSNIWLWQIKFWNSWKSDLAFFNSKKKVLQVISKCVMAHCESDMVFPAYWIDDFLDLGARDLKYLDYIFTFRPCELLQGSIWNGWELNVKCVSTRGRLGWSNQMDKTPNTKQTPKVYLCKIRGITGATATRAALRDIFWEKPCGNSS